MANRLSNSFCRIAIFLLGVFLVVPSVNAGYLDGLNTDGNLAAWYAFDEGTGSSTADSSSNGNTGTLYGVSWLTDSNCVKGACVLSDLNDTIQISPGPTFSNTAANGFASAGWVFGMEIPVEVQRKIFCLKNRLTILHWAFRIGRILTFDAKLPRPRMVIKN